MKTKLTTIAKLFMLFFAILGSVSMQAQVIAGNVPLGGYAVNPNLNFSILNIYDDTTGTLDLNCDNIPDLEVQMIKGPTAIDGPNLIYLYVLNPAYSVCADTLPGIINQVNYYNAGDALNCTGSLSWGNDTIFKLGDYGCLGCFGPWTITDKYFAYTDGNQTGWLKVSFDLMDSGGPLPITFSMNEFLAYCYPNSIDENSGELNFQISPNPTVDGKINLQYKGSISEIVVYNSIGQKVDFLLSGTELFLPETKGVYVVKIKNSSGNYLSKSVVRN